MNKHAESKAAHMSAASHLFAIVCYTVYQNETCNYIYMYHIMFLVELKEKRHYFNILKKAKETKGTSPTIGTTNHVKE